MTCHEDLRCQELVELVTDYLEDALPPPVRAQFEAHLEACPGCRTYIEQLRQTVCAVGRLTEQSLDPAAREQLLGLFRNWKRGHALFAQL